MAAKSDRTKQLILSTATRLFARMGYSAVTMKDICQATRLSRGGLYRYFGSTRDIFIAMLESDIDEGRTAVAQGIEQGAPAAVIFEHFLQHEKAAILGEEHGLYFAIHEFAFVEADMRPYFERRLADTVEILSAIFRHGQAGGEFKAFDPAVIANHVIYFLDSLKTSSPIFSINEEMVEQQFQILRELMQ